jgi:hypothetical protein
LSVQSPPLRPNHYLIIRVTIYFSINISSIQHCRRQHVTFEVHLSDCHNLFNKPSTIESQKAFINAYSSLTWLIERCFKRNIVLISITTTKVSIHYSTSSNEVMVCHACNDNFGLRTSFITWQVQQNPPLQLENSK